MSIFQKEKERVENLERFLTICDDIIDTDVLRTDSEHFVKALEAK